MNYVYFLRSLDGKSKTYVGMTEDIDARLVMHNTVRVCRVPP